MAPQLTLGVDTHLDVHVAALLDERGALLGVESFDTTPDGYRNLLGWASGQGEVALAATATPQVLFNEMKSLSMGRSGIAASNSSRGKSSAPANRLASPDARRHGWSANIGMRRRALC